MSEGKVAPSSQAKLVIEPQTPKRKFSGWMSSQMRLPTREDLIASVVVFIVALPLSLGIALASGGTPAAGLIAAVVGGIVAGLLAGAPLSVTGPAAGMSALVLQLVQTHGIGGLALITVFAGVIQIILGALRAGKLFKLLPHSVLEGVLSAIGLIILIGQLHVLTGSTIPRSFAAGVVGLPASFSQFGPVLACGLLAILIQVFWSSRMKKLSWIPGALPAVILVTALSSFWVMPRVVLEPILPLVQGSLSSFLDIDKILSGFGPYFFPALGVAIVASAESLLTARAVDTLVSDRPDFQPAHLNKELAAQGMANVVSGAIGGLPVTAVMVRSAANINSGAKTRWSSVFHGVWILVFLALAPALIAQIPLTALASVLVITGFRLVNFPRLVQELRQHPKEGMLWIASSVLILATDLLTGLGLSLVLAAIVNYQRGMMTRVVGDWVTRLRSLGVDTSAGESQGES